MSEYKSIEQINEELREACSEGNLEIVNSLLYSSAKGMIFTAYQKSALKHPSFPKKF